MIRNTASGESRPHLFGYTPERLLAELARLDPRDRLDRLADIRDARRILAHLISDGGDSPRPLRRPVPRRVREAVEKNYRWERLRIEDRVEDEADGFVKYLFRSPDGALSEAVRIPLHRPGRFTVCLSSQVGCAMACDFCATGRLGLTRDLEAWEMVSAFMQVRDEAPGRVTGAVFQGQGEPLHNYDEVMRAAEVLSDPCGGRISAQAITISTVGLVEQIRRFTREKRPYKLIVSLTSAVEPRRRRLLPVAGNVALAELAAAIRERAQATGERVTIAWVLIGGENTGADEIAALDELLGDVPVRINLIDVNDARDGGYPRAGDAERNAFIDELAARDIPFIRRYSGGAARHAACGMLAATRARQARGPDAPDAQA